jgi:hypothetical protein
MKKNVFFLNYLIDDNVHKNKIVFKVGDERVHFWYIKAL